MDNSFIKATKLFTKSEKKRLGFLASGIIVNGLLEVLSLVSLIPFLTVAANPELIQKNEYLRFAYQTLGFHGNREFLIFIGFAVFLSVLFVNISNALVTWFNLKFTWLINHTLSVRLMRHYMGLDYISFIQRNSADMQKNIQYEVMAFATNFINSVLTFISKGISLLMILTVLILIDPLLALSVGVIFGLSYFIIYVLARKKLFIIGQHSLQDNEVKFRALNEAIGVFKIAKLLHLEEYFTSLFSNASYRFSQNQSKRMTITQMPKFAVETIAFTIMICICLYIIGVKPSFTEAIPILAVYAYAAYKIMPQMQQVYTSYSVLHSWLPHVKNLICEFAYVYHPNTSQNLQEPAAYSSRKALQRNHIIELQNVSFSFQNSKRITIDNVSLSIPYRNTVGFCGETGSGKTTIIDLIMGIITPETGRIIVHGQPLNSDNKESWQKSIGYVPQDIYLMDSSIAENVAFGIPKDKIDYAQVRKCCNLANVAHFIEKELINTYETVVGERAVRLSGGQRQRIGIARALYYDPDVLIFDEATSALDNETEKVLMKAIDNLSQSKTIILIAHRLTTLEKCDFVYKIDKGRIVNFNKWREDRL